MTEQRQSPARAGLKIVGIFMGFLLFLHLAGWSVTHAFPTDPDPADVQGKNVYHVQLDGL